VIDSILKTIATLLAPMSSSFDNRLGVWRNTDLVLLSWLLLFLSVCLDDTSEKKENSNPRWDFMSGDIVKARLSMSNSSSRSFSRSFKKRFLQNKQGNSNQNIAEKVYMMSEQIANAPTMLSNSSGNLDSVINKAQDLKNHLKKLLPAPESEYSMFKNFLKKTTTDPKTSCTAPSISINVSNKNDNADATNESAFDRGLKSVRPQNMLVVIRGLFGLLLNMDFTCNMDLFLLTCKIIAKLVNACKISIQLSSIMTTQQLLQLVRIAVWENQQHPWAVHAITCLLQDILEADRSYKLTALNDENETIDTLDGSSGSEMSLAQAFGFISDFPASTSSGQPSSSLFKDICNYDVFKTEPSKYQLPSLIEDDTDGIEEILDDILEQSKKFATSSIGKKDNAPTPPSRNGIYTFLYRSKVSSTMDSRLEYGLETNIEIFLRRSTIKSTANLIASLPQMETKETIATDVPPWPENIINWNHADYLQKNDTNLMLMEVFETIFSDLHLEDSWLNLEQVLQLWLTLNGGDGNGESPKIIFSNLQSKIPFGEKGE
jgi:baculoviral IAP repeat-containing protein 6 (apollon)